MILWVLAMLCLGFLGCEVPGPWSYYPEERPLYRGVYTYGWVEVGGTPHVCFSKLYALTETAAEDFAFYDSAYVSVSGKFENEGETTIVLEPTNKDPNCFETTVAAYGIQGEDYNLEATFKWDSLGKTVVSSYKATASIPDNFAVKGVNVPLPMKQYKWYDYSTEKLTTKFLDFPFDMDAYKFALDYDSTVGGALLIMEYDVDNGGESMNTTINFMVRDLTEPDSLGYTKLSMHNGFEHLSSLGYSSNEVIAGIHTLDTIMTTNMTLPVADIVMHFYATDKAYADYRNFMLQSFNDPRIVPRSNIENGMGVFSGMLRVDYHIEVTADDAVPYDHIRKVDCADRPTDPDSAFNTKVCRLFGEKMCIDTLSCDGEGCVEYKVDQEVGYCHPIAVKFAMTLDTTRWSIFLPDTLSEKRKNNAYADGLKRYCVASNFRNNSIAQCDEIYNDCQVDLNKNYCKKYLWQWCSDRNWDLETYPQCGTGLVSRYYIEKQKSVILDRVVEKWCKDHPQDKQCREN